MPNRFREKGNREERRLVRLLQDAGFGTERVPLSGASGGRFGCDLSVPLMGRDWRVEVKVRNKGFTMLYDWLEHAKADFLIVRADLKPSLVVIPLSEAIKIAKAAEKSKCHVIKEIPSEGMINCTSGILPERVLGHSARMLVIEIWRVMLKAMLEEK